MWVVLKVEAVMEPFLETQDLRFVEYRLRKIDNWGEMSEKSLSIREEINPQQSH